MTRRLSRPAALAGTAALPALTFPPGGPTAQSGREPTQGARIVVPAGPRRTTANLAPHPGRGQWPRLAGAWFLQLTGTRAEHGPYRGAAPALNDRIAGVTQFFFDNLPPSLEFMRPGKLRALGLPSAQPNPLPPDVPP